MSENLILYLIFGSAGLFVVVIAAYLIINKVLNKNDARRIKKLREGTKEKSHSLDVTYQKLYIIYLKIPLINRYVKKLRRRLEIINIEDEYVTRKQTASIITKVLLLMIPLTLLIIAFSNSDKLLLGILLIFELFLTEAVIDGMADKVDNKLLKQQIDFFSEVRHAYHEYNMVEEAIYEAAQNDELEVSNQADRIYEILISDDPESELEKYYDVAPNSFLKEFAGVSYLTKEFGDRKDREGASLYLKNLNNITQEMQLEILKRDKLDYVFQSLSLIAAVPILFLNVVKDWAISQFSFTSQFYNGKSGLIVQMLIVVVTFICYLLIRKLKENGESNVSKNIENPFQEKIYRNKIGKKIIDAFVPKQGTKEYRKLSLLLKEAASKQKMEWIYVNRIGICALAFIASLILCTQLHRITIDYVYSQPTSDYNILGQMSEKDTKKAMKITEQDNFFINLFKSKKDVTQEQIQLRLGASSYYENATDKELETAAERIYGKLQIVQNEYLQWFELLVSLLIGIVGYYGPIWLLMFQKRMRQIEMENEVMQFQTIILMLMKIERVNVEIILEWIERYSNIFREPISKCVNNYESGPWEALEELKNDIAYSQLIRIVESLQAAVEKIPIAQAFDELDTERAYYQEKRKESNERLISRKGLIGKAIGFAPMVCLFVGYLIVPLVAIGLSSMTSSFSTMSGMM